MTCCLAAEASSSTACRIVSRVVTGLEHQDPVAKLALCVCIHVSVWIYLARHCLTVVVCLLLRVLGWLMTSLCICWAPA